MESFVDNQKQKRQSEHPDSRTISSNKDVGKRWKGTMPKFEKITVEVLVKDEVFTKYLRSATIAPSKKGGAFVGNYEIAPDEFRKYGIVLPKGGMIIPDLESGELKRFLNSLQSLRREKELKEFGATNDIQFLDRLFSAEWWEEIWLFSPMTESDLEMIQKNWKANLDLVKTKIIQNSHVYSLVMGVEFSFHAIDPPKSLSGVQIGHLFSPRTGKFYFPTEESLRHIDAEYQEDLRKKRAKNLDSYRQMLADNPQNKVILRCLGEDGGYSVLDMNGRRYSFSSEEFSAKIVQRMKDKFFAFDCEIEAEIATMVADEIEPHVEKVSERWSVGIAEDDLSAAGLSGRGPFFGESGIAHFEELYLGSVKLDPLRKEYYKKMLRAKQSGIDVRPRKN